MHQRNINRRRDILCGAIRVFPVRPAPWRATIGIIIPWSVVQIRPPLPVFQYLSGHCSTIWHRFGTSIPRSTARFHAALCGLRRTGRTFGAALRPSAKAAHAGLRQYPAQPQISFLSASRTLHSIVGRNWPSAGGSFWSFSRWISSWWTGRA